MRAVAGLIPLLVCAAAHAADPRATLADLESRLAKMGPAKVEGTDAVAGRTVPVLFFGSRKVNGNYAVVDAVRKEHNATASLFVKDGDEFVRVATNVLTPEGRRGVGTTLAHNKAYQAVSHGQVFCGDVDVLGTRFNACYAPVKDSSGKLVGASYVGHKN